MLFWSSKNNVKKSFYMQMNYFKIRKFFVYIFLKKIIGSGMKGLKIF